MMKSRDRLGRHGSIMDFNHSQHAQAIVLILAGGLIVEKNMRYQDAKLLRLDMDCSGAGYPKMRKKHPNIPKWSFSTGKPTIWGGWTIWDKAICIFSCLMISIHWTTVLKENTGFPLEESKTQWCFIKPKALLIKF